MAFFTFGEYSKDTDYKSVDEHIMRGSATILLLLSLLAFTNGFMMRNFEVLPFITGFIMLNFFIGTLINPKFAPTIILAKIFNHKEPLAIGAVQKHFAWGLGLIMSSLTLLFSILLLDDIRFFEPLCALCILCTTLLYFEVVFNACIGCKLYHKAVSMNLIKEPNVKPRCTGDRCEV